LNAFSVVYLGVFDRHYRYERNGEKTRVDPRQSVLEARAAGPRQEWQLGSRQLFAKVQYLWRV
jgi:hypothetical protein